MSYVSSSKSILITGCSSGFGRLLVESFLNDNWQVTATTRNPESLQDICNDRLTILALDVGLPQERHRIVEAVKDRYSNGLNCLINNAGYSLAGPLEVLTTDQIYHQFEVNFFAPLFLTRDLLPLLRKTSGKVINVSSVLGYVGMPMQSLYVASKFALEGLGESLYHELLEQGVQVILVEPGGFRTGFAGNTKWAHLKTNEQVTAYGKELQGYRTFLSRSSSKARTIQPELVADQIKSLVLEDKNPLRYRIGFDAEALYFIKHFLPQCLSEYVLHKISRRILGTN